MEVCIKMEIEMDRESDIKMVVEMDMGVGMEQQAWRWLGNDCNPTHRSSIGATPSTPTPK